MRYSTEYYPQTAVERAIINKIAHHNPLNRAERGQFALIVAEHVVTGVKYKVQVKTDSAGVKYFVFRYG